MWGEGERVSFENFEPSRVIIPKIDVPFLKRGSLKFFKQKCSCEPASITLYQLNWKRTQVPRSKKRIHDGSYLRPMFLLPQMYGPVERFLPCLGILRSICWSMAFVNKEFCGVKCYFGRPLRILLFVEFSGSRADRHIGKD